jgi:hypothetical protein
LISGNTDACAGHTFAILQIEQLHQRTGWMPGRYFVRWKKEELARAFRRAGWDVLLLKVVSNQERKGRWINIMARR